jgi:EAL domain-containing protein (putative c-di-GMP-specific phosphodiesterase class I)/CHASE2 domain-containing sensor protein
MVNAEEANLCLLIRPWEHGAGFDDAMRLPPSLSHPAARRLNLRILAVAICVAAICGAINLMEPLELTGLVARNKMHRHPPSGDTILVAIDDQSVQHYGQIPWPKLRIGEVARRLHEAGARRIAVDVGSWGDESPLDDHRFEQLLGSLDGSVVMPALFVIDPLHNEQKTLPPPARLAKLARFASTPLDVHWDNNIHQAPYATLAGSTILPSIPSAMTDTTGEVDETFPIDYSVKFRSIPTISALDIMEGRWNPAAVAGKAVVIGETSSTAQRHGSMGYGQVPLAAIHVMAIETLRTGRPIVVGWLAPCLPALAFAVIFLFAPNRLIARSTLALGTLFLMFGPMWLEESHIFALVMPALMLLFVVTVGHLWFNFKRTVRTRGMTNAISGLPNLNALRIAGHALGDTVVVARILNFAEVATALPAECEKELVEQIVNRLSVGAGGATIYQADDGLFIWLAASTTDDRLGEQLVALHALFRSPVIVASRLIDLHVSFGLDGDEKRSLVQRASSALVAADRAASEGRRWMTYDPAELEDAEWKMSILARLDQAIERGEIWVAYQPKVELATGRIIGAEALARWSHPEKGEIPPSQFIPAAERGGRIENLTAYVLNAALEATALIRKSGFAQFSMSVNLSARLLDNPNLLPMVQEALARHRLPPHRLILEVTETTAMASQDQAFAALQALSAAGIRLSIDDYGTGFSTLDYLKRIPAEEIKIDRSFISMLEKSQSDRIMVHSTIQLAHSLGRKAVAEGVENGIVLNELRLMQCDHVQGYFTGKPMKLHALIRELSDQTKVAAA